MRRTISSRLPAIACALSLLVCLALVRPWLDMGTNDDPSYTRTAQLLAQTGHIVYNGWSAPILGWQLFLAAAFIKLFGFSFTVVRLSILPVAMAAAFLTQRSMVRAGLTEWNATLATLTLVLSPLFVPLMFSYMTDIPGYFVIVLCFYGCLRALQARTDARTCAWVLFAAISSGVGGTCRQIAWLGFIVMVPSVLWLIRKRRVVLLIGACAVLLAAGIAFSATAWYNRQPYAIPERLLHGGMTGSIGDLVRSLAAEFFDVPLFLLAVLLAFLPQIRSIERRGRMVLIACCALSLGILVFTLTRPDPLFWLMPSGHNYVTSHGVTDGSFIRGERPVLLSERVRIVLTVISLFAASCFAAVLSSRRISSEKPPQAGITAYQLAVLSIPFVLVYIALLLPRAMLDMIFDRYLIPLLFLALLGIARFYQNRVAGQLPRFCVVWMALGAAYSVAATHDAFAMLRARLAAAKQIEAAGVPDRNIDGGWEFNIWVQIRDTGHLEPHAGEASKQTTPSSPSPCHPQLWRRALYTRPIFAVSFTRNDCLGPTDFPPVAYDEWLGPHRVNIYVVKVNPIPPTPEP